MSYEFKLPDIGEGVVEGEVVRWLVKEGDLLGEDQPMVEIMTDKATIEIPAPRAGRVGKRMFAEGEMCAVGKVLIVIDTEEPAPAKAAASAPAVAAVPPAAASPASGPTSPARGGNGAALLATPATRKLARELGVDLATVLPTGPAGRITSDDVRLRHRGGALAPDAPVRAPFRGLRKKIAENMVLSKNTAAHLTYMEEYDVTELVAVQKKLNTRLKERGQHISYLPFIVHAVVDGLKKFPQMNATLDVDAGEIVQYRHYHIGIATATPAGLIVPVLRDADRRDILGLSAEIERVVAATRAGKASREDLSGSTFTITSLGAIGGLFATPIINFPEVAILAVHKIARRPVVLGDSIVIRDMMNLSISFDHRLLDGYDAATFMQYVKELLEHPQGWIDAAIVRELGEVSHGS